MRPPCTRPCRQADSACLPGRVRLARYAAVLEKLDEEVGELRAELAEGDPARLADEVGDLLFVLANLARKLDLDPEACLRQANLKFERRFSMMEVTIESKRLTLSEISLQEMETAWQQVKQAERAGLDRP